MALAHMSVAEKKPKKKKGKSGGVSMALYYKDMEIGLLQGKLDTANQRILDSSKEVQKLKEQLDKQQEDQRSVFEYLKKELSATEEELYRLRDDKVAIRAEKNREIFDLEAKIVSEGSKYEASEKQLKQQLDIMKSELQKYEDFKLHRHEILGELDEAKKALDEERKERQRIVAELNREVVQEKHKLTMEMKAKIQEARDQLLRLTEESLEDTTKRTILENEQISAQLIYQSRQIEEERKKHKLMIEENRKLKLDVELGEEVQGQIARKNASHLRLIRTLMTKIRKLEEERVKLKQKQKQERDGAIQMQSLSLISDGDGRGKDEDESVEGGGSVSIANPNRPTTYTYTQSSDDQLQYQYDSDTHTQRIELVNALAVVNRVAHFLLRCSQTAEKQQWPVPADVKARSEGEGEVDTELEERMAALKQLVGLIAVVDEGVDGDGQYNYDYEPSRTAILELDEALDALEAVEHRMLKGEHVHAGTRAPLPLNVTSNQAAVGQGQGFSGLLSVTTPQSDLFGGGGGEVYPYPGAIEVELRNVGVQTETTTSRRLFDEVKSDVRDWGSTSSTLPPAVFTGIAKSRAGGLSTPRASQKKGRAGAGGGGYVSGSKTAR